MIKNYFSLAFRSIWNNKVYAAINMIGFAVGISACLFILLWIRDEKSFDRFHTKSDRIYRLLVDVDSRVQPRTPHPLAQQMVIDYPEVEKAVTMSPIWDAGLTPAQFSVKYEDIVYDEKRFFSADTTFFEIFDFPFLAGNPRTALKEPMNLVITRDMAIKYFGSVREAIGKSLKINDQSYITVNGVIENVPSNSHFTFDFLVSYVTMKQIDRQNHGGILSDYYTWNDFGHYNYLLLKKGTDVKQLEKKLNKWLLVQNFIPLNEKYHQLIVDGRFQFKLQPMNDIHLHSNIMWELGTNGNILYVYIFLTAALLILIVACVNFMNLSTARSLKRAKEVGIRKAIGVQRKQLVFQFLIESVVLTLFSAFIALIIVYAFLPVFNNFTGKGFILYNLLNPQQVWKLLLGVLVIGIFAGSYPAFYLSSFIPYEVLKGKVQTGGSQLTIRKFLVIFQFTISILLIICTMVIYKQISYLRNRDLGFNQEQVVVISLKDNGIRNQFDAIRTSLLVNPAIIKVAGTSSIPGGQFNQNSISFEGESDEKLIAETFVTSDYFDLLQIKTSAGRVFSDDFMGDTTASFVINESAGRLYKWDSPVDKTITYYGDNYGNATGKIIGVVKDYNIHSLQQPIEPLIILLGKKYLLTYMIIKISPENIPATLAFIEKTWGKFDNRHAFSYSFLDALFASQYQSEKRMGTIFWIFALMAIFIASLGLFGLSNFMIEQRTKEIGIRKAHGAGVVNILIMLSRQFAAWVIIASILALPLGYMIARNWLENFAYRTTIGIVVFILAVLISIAVTLLTISYQAWHTARMNPVESLKYE